MAEGKALNWKDIVWITLIIISGMGAYFSSTATIEKDIIRIEARCDNTDLKIQSNEEYVKDDIREIKEDLKEMKDVDLKEIKADLRSLLLGSDN